MLDNYNERLFEGKSFRSKLHIARYTWLCKKLKQYECKADTILELGCFDGKTLEYLEHTPIQYDGYDANWEGGLDIGINKWKGHNNYHLHLCKNLNDFQPQENCYDISICQETLEHLPLLDLDTYLERLAKATKTYSFISVPNEKGIVFLAKHIMKILTQDKSQREDFSFFEVFHATMGNLKKVRRTETRHKGFDYAELKKKLQKHFIIVETNGLPLDMLPGSLNFTVGFVCKRKMNI